MAVVCALGLLFGGQPVAHAQRLGSRCGGPSEDGWIERLLRADGRFDAVLDAAQTHRLQILVAEISAAPAGGERCLAVHTYRAGAEYYYPASAIKIIAAVAALRRLEGRQRDVPAFAAVDLDTPLSIDPLRIADPAGSDELIEVSPGIEQSTLRELVREALIVSSNAAYNRLYDIAGAEAMNDDMWALGLESVRVTHRFSMGFVDWAVHRWLPRVVFRPGGRALELHDARLQPDALPPAAMSGLQIGRAYRGAHRERIDGPLDFAIRNAASLVDLHRLLRALVDPVAGPEPLELGLSEVDRTFLVDTLTESAPATEEATAEEQDARYKPLMPGVLRVIPDRAQIRYVSKAGRAYGFHIENAYIEHRPSGRAFYVATTIYANANNVLNDNHYEYDDVSYAYLRDLGEVLARELLVE